MRWFKSKNLRSKEKKSEELETFDVRRPTSHVPRPTFNRLLFIMAVFVSGALFIHTGLVQSELVILTQDQWGTEKYLSNTVLPVEEWEEYSVKDAGIVAGDDLHLESAGYMLIQTSDDGVADTCVTENCSTGNGFNGATAVKTGTMVSGTGVDASVKLVITSSSDEFTLNLLGSYDTSDASGVTVEGNTAYIADGTAGLRIVDITTASSPLLLATYNTAGKARNVVVSGNTAYIAGHKPAHIILQEKLLMLLLREIMLMWLMKIKDYRSLTSVRRHFRHWPKHMLPPAKL